MPGTNYVAHRKIFIGSSVEGLNVAEALFHHFYHERGWQAYLWTDVQFILSKATLASLEKFLNDYDYGVFVLTPDDELKKRGDKKKVPRDNVLFELGLFLGHAGSGRTFIVSPKQPEIHLPTDLSGITCAKYDPGETEEELNRNLFSAAREIKICLRKYEEEQQEMARGELLKNIAQVKLNLNRARTDQQRMQIVINAFDQMLKLKAQATNSNIRDTLEDILMFTQSLMDIMDPEQLAKEQRQSLRAVWVYSSSPLELHPTNRTLAEQVLQNLHKGVKYTYFLDDETKTRLIISSLMQSKPQDMPIEEKQIEQIKNNLSAVVLPPQDFLTYYTVHFLEDESFCVYQSIIREGRKDFLFSLDPNQSKRVVEIMQAKLETHKAQPFRL